MFDYKLKSFVNDFSGVLDEKIEKEFNDKFFTYNKKSGVQIATAFISHRNGRELKDIALEIFNKNGIGEKQTNSGLLLIVVTGEKKIRIMTGKGMEIEFPNSLARDIIQKELRGLMNSGKYDQLLKSWYELSTKIRNVNDFSSSFYQESKNGINNNFEETKKDATLFSRTINLFVALIFGTVVLNIIGISSWIIWFLAGVFIFLFFVLFSGNFRDKKLKSYLVYFIFFLLILSVILIISGKAGNNYTGVGGNSSYDSSFNSNWGSSSSYDYGSSSSSSSFGSSSNWGGGSSNGGGFGD